MSSTEAARPSTSPVADDGRAVLEDEAPFALIAKPCDVGAIRRLARLDARVGRQLRYALTFVCGGASDLSKSEDVIRHFGVRESELTLFRYRGHGNPGLTRAETRDGRSFGITYNEMWEDERTWGIQPRCKICPDSLGESADIVCSDVWPGGGPTGEGEGRNGIIVRTRRGLALYREALRAGVVVESGSMSFRDLDGFQPHQVRKKRAVWARHAGMRAAGMAVPEADGLRLPDCARLNGWTENLDEARGARRRARTGHSASRRRGAGWKTRPARPSRRKTRPETPGLGRVHPPALAFAGVGPSSRGPVPASER